MTNKIYLEDTYQFHSEVLISQAGEDEKGVFIVLDQTVFYPQGGGQPSDQGVIKSDHFETNVTRVIQIGDEVRHYVTSPYNEIPVGSKVHCSVNQERRLLNSRYHTAAHLFGNIVEKLYPEFKAIKGHSFPGEAYVEFQGDGEIDSISAQNAINEAIARGDKTTSFEIEPVAFERQFYKLPYAIPENKKFRAIQIGDMPPIPCGGTHLSSIGEIKNLSLGKIKAKSDVLRIFYEVT